MSKAFEYVYYYDPKNKYANKCGNVYEHMIIAEQILGRELKKGEVVHHKDKNKKNNSIDNLIVFTNNKEHVRFHNYNCDEKLLHKRDDGAYDLNEQLINKKIDTCPICGKIKSIQADVCIECYLKK